MKKKFLCRSIDIDQPIPVHKNSNLDQIPCNQFLHPVNSESNIFSLEFYHIISL